MCSISDSVAATYQASSADGALPSVAIIVPTFNRASMLGRTLSSLLALDYPRDRLEVLVVDNSSTDHTEHVVREAMARSTFPIRYLRKENFGPAAARNHGLAHSGSDIVGFTDSDCRVPADWVRNAVRHMTPGVGLVTGPIRPIWPDGLGFFHHQLAPVNAETWSYPTANAFYRRDALDRLGYFDERFGAYRWGPPVAGEDTELAWRVKRGGYASVFAADAPVDHEASAVGIKAWLVDPVRVHIFTALLRRAPEIRRYLWFGHLAGIDSLIFLLAVLGVALGLKGRRVLFVLGLPWIWQRRHVVTRDRWPPRRWWRIPVKYGLLAERQTLTIVTLLFASVRDRYLVL